MREKCVSVPLLIDHGVARAPAYGPDPTRDGAGLISNRRLQT